MPRVARQQSESGIYHIMIRGIDHQRIFKDEEDNAKFLRVLKDCKAISEFNLLAYCLMGNHAHLLLKIGNENSEQIMKRIGVRYVYWYNRKYARCGHLFQDRFKSEPVDDDTYLLAAVRYIHRNPVKAGICKNISDYKWSSYADYIRPGSDGLTDTAFVFEILPQNKVEEFHNQNTDDACLDLDERAKRLTDERFMKDMFQISKCKNAAEFQQLEAAKRDLHIGMLREKGYSIRQISRLTGISKGIVERHS